MSRATLYRRLKEAGILPDDRTALTNLQLDDLLCAIKRDQLKDGEASHLVRQVVLISRERLRQSVHMPALLLDIAVQFVTVCIQFPILITCGT